MATRTSERLEAAQCFKTKYDGLVDLEAAVQGGTAIAALLVLDVSSTPPTAVQLNAAKLEWDSFKANAAYEGATAPALANANLWAKIADEAGGGSAVCSSDEKYAAYYEIKSLITYLTTTKTAVATDSDVSTLMAIDFSSVTPTAVQLNAAKVGWDAIRNGSVYVYGGCSIPSVTVNGPLWNEISTEAAA